MPVNLRYLSWINTMFCVVLVGVIGWQWKTSANLEQKFHTTQKDLQQSQSARQEAEHKNAVLQADVDGLKKALDDMRAEATTQKAALAKEQSAQGENREQINTVVKDANEQIAKWNAAVKERDAKIIELNSSLVATRARLEQAILQIRAANRKQP